MISNLEIHNFSFFNRYRTFDLNTNSKIYKEDNNLYKIPTIMRRELIDALKYVDENKIKGMVKVKNFITDNGKIIGYSMHNYTNYKSLYKNKFRKFKDKIEDSLKIIDYFEYLNENDLYYADQHVGNMLLNTNSNKLLLCDLDTLRIEKDNYYKRMQTFSAIALVVSYLYGVSQEDADTVVLHSVIDIDDTGYIRDCINSVGQKDFKDRVKKIRKLKYRDIPSINMKISGEAWDYYRSGYGKFD